MSEAMFSATGSARDWLIIEFQDSNEFDKMVDSKHGLLISLMMVGILFQHFIEGPSTSPSTTGSNAQEASEEPIVSAAHIAGNIKYE